MGTDVFPKLSSMKNITVCEAATLKNMFEVKDKTLCGTVVRNQETSVQPESTLGDLEPVLSLSA